MDCDEGLVDCPQCIMINGGITKRSNCGGLVVYTLPRIPLLLPRLKRWRTLEDIDLPEIGDGLVPEAQKIVSAGNLQAQGTL